MITILLHSTFFWYTPRLFLGKIAELQGKLTYGIYKCEIQIVYSAI
jgi:hypothetical protein